MRKLIVGLMVVGLLAGFAGQASAQFGTGDRLGLISSAAIAPFWGSTGNVTVFEVTSPVGSNLDGHMVFFTANCTRTISRPLPLTTNDIEVFGTNDVFITYNGLVVIAASLDGNSLVPLPNPIHVRSHWINVAEDFMRTADPISAQHAESPGATWNPLRTGASFGAPPEGTVFQTTLFLVCPNYTANTLTVLGTLPATSGFPPQDFITPFSTSTPLISGRVYDDDEDLLINIVLRCECLTSLPIATLDPSIRFAYESGLTYTELVTYLGPPPAPTSLLAFTGYRAVRVTSAGVSLDGFGALNNASASAYNGQLIPGLR